MLACPLPKSIIAQARPLAFVAAGWALSGSELAAQTPVHTPPIRLIAPALTTYQSPVAGIPALPPAAVPAPVLVPMTVYPQAIPARASASRRSSPPSMSRSSFSERWTVNLKVSGRGFRP